VKVGGGGGGGGGRSRLVAEVAVGGEKRAQLQMQARCMFSFIFGGRMCQFLLTIALFFVFQTGDVPWLAEVSNAPLGAPVASRKLALLLSEEESRSSDRLLKWKDKRKEFVTKWNEFLGPMPERPKSTAIEVLKTEELAKVTRKLIRYENEPGQFLEAYLLEPVATGAPARRPGLVALHATTDKTNEPIAGIGGRDDEQLGLKLAEQGFVVICPRNFLWQDAASLDEAVKKLRQRHPKTLGMHKMLFDAQRAVDILAAIPEVDRKRLGAVGHSLGAKEVLYLTAFDERICAAVFSEGGVAFDSTNWDASWYLGPEIRKEDFPRNHHELIALIAPRPFLVLGGESGRGAADGDRSWPYLAAARHIYELYGGTPRLGLLNHREGHAISAKSFERLAEWLRVYLEVESK
jgi:dienelactone hydrolase